MNFLKPMLLTCLKSYDRSQFIKDVTAGIIVAIIALPLSIALALASGVGPEAGIFTAIVAGFVISALGGSCVQIAGPTAAFATIVAGIVARDGMDGLIIATIMAGIFLILMGLFHFGSLIKFIPYTITTGFTSGIAVTIVIGQLKDFFRSYLSGWCKTNRDNGENESLCPEYFFRKYRCPDRWHCKSCDFDPCSLYF